MKAITDKKTIINYLNGTESDHKGRSYIETLKWTDAELERCHDQVQWIFPLHEASKHAKVAPIVTPEIVNEAKKDKRVIKNLLLAVERFKEFYGIGEHEDFQKQSQWCQDRDHNLLRITRIIRCLRLFDLDLEACEFYADVMKVANRYRIQNGKTLNQATGEYWFRALTDNRWDTL